MSEICIPALHEPTVLAWLCGCDVRGIAAGARVRGIRFSERYLLSLRDMVSLAWHLGTVLEVRRAASRMPMGRYAVKVHVRQGSEHWVDLWGVREDGRVVRRLWCWTDGEEEPAAATDTGYYLLNELFMIYARGGARVRQTSWLIPVGRVHG
jgi:hypothetical protein